MSALMDSMGLYVSVISTNAQRVLVKTAVFVSTVWAPTLVCVEKDTRGSKYGSMIPGQEGLSLLNQSQPHVMELFFFVEKLQ